MDTGNSDDINRISLSSLLESANIGIVIHRWDTSIIYANPTALTLLRLTYNQVIGKDAMDPAWNFIDDGNRKLQVEEYPVNKVKRFQSPLTNEMLGLVDSSSMNVSWFMVNAYAEYSAQEEDGFIVVTFNDITQEKFLFSCQDVLDKTQDIVVVTEAENIDYPLGPKIVYVNKAFEKLTGYRATEVIGETPRLLQGKETSKAERKKIAKALHKKKPVTATVLNYSKSGHPYWLEMNIVPLKNRYGEVTHFAAIERDVTQQIYHAEQLEKRNCDLKVLKQDLEKVINERTDELRRANQKLERLAFYDGLTNIPNRRAFLDKAKGLLSMSTRHGFSIAIGILDLDYFKQINDTYGHHIGDAVLIEVGACFIRFFRQEDVYGRIGGEEFSFVIVVKNSSNALTIANRLLDNIKAIKVPSGQQTEIQLSASIGLFQAPSGSELDLNKAMLAADGALYEAKESGRAQVKIAQ